MAIAGAWRAAQGDTVAYVGALKQGTGANPIHASRQNGTGRNTAPDGSVTSMDDSLVGEDTYGFCDEDSASALWGYGVQTGTADRPGLNDSPDVHNAGRQDWPAWGPYEAGRPGGTPIRTINKGATALNTAKSTPRESAADGQQNKLTGDVEDAVTSNASQYEMQTSMRQRDQTRAGSQSSGTANEFNAPIRSRITGQRLKFNQPQSRHYDMQPREQAPIVRPFFLRTAGTGDQSAMEANAMYQTQPMVRTPPDNADQGPDVEGNSAGYTSEDLGYYY